MAVVFVFKDTKPLVNSGHMYVAPHHGLPLEPHELVRVRVAIKIADRIEISVRVGIRVGVRARGRFRMQDLHSATKGICIVPRLRSLSPLFFSP